MGGGALGAAVAFQSHPEAQQLRAELQSDTTFGTPGPCRRGSNPSFVPSQVSDLG